MSQEIIFLNSKLKKSWEATLPEVETISNEVIKQTIHSICDCDISFDLTLTCDEHITSLNQEFRDKDSPTNVLSFRLSNFSYKDKISENVNQEIYLGEIFISLETIQKEALEYHKSFHDRFIHILIHGILHLFGYDHMMEEDRMTMEEKETAIAAKFGVQNLWHYHD